jgi:hypothetical protein
VAKKFTDEELSDAREGAAYDYKQIVEDPIAVAELLTQKWLRNQHEFHDLVDSEDHPNEFLPLIQRDAAICAYATKILAEGVVYRLTLADRRLRNLQMLVGVNIALTIAICWILFP